MKTTYGPLTEMSMSHPDLLNCNPEALSLSCTFIAPLRSLMYIPDLEPVDYGI